MLLLATSRLVRPSGAKAPDLDVCVCVCVFFFVRVCVRVPLSGVQRGTVSVGAEPVKLGLRCSGTG